MHREVGRLGQLPFSRRPPATTLWATTALILIAVWFGLLFASASTVYVLAAVIVTIWLPAFAWWYTRPEVTGSEDS